MTRNEAYNRLREARKLPDLPEWFAWQHDDVHQGAPTVSWANESTRMSYVADTEALEIIDKCKAEVGIICLPMAAIKALQEAHDMVTVYMKEMVDG